MKIDFFDTCNGMDPRATKHGIYMIELRRDDKKVCLYVGESVWIAARCGVHLYSLYENPNYLGLTKEDIDNDEFTLSFTVVHSFANRKTVLGCEKYKVVELETIQKNKPLTQLDSSDRQIRDVEEKIQKVQKELKYRGLK